MAETNRPPISDEAISEALQRIGHRLRKRLEQKGPGVWLSSHEVLGAITEEYQELVDAVKANAPMSVEHELEDIAVAALFGLACDYDDRLEW